jgi:hypothetical protein
MTEMTNDIEDALVAWWQARNVLEETGGRVASGIESLEHARAVKTEQSARDRLHRAMERLLAQLSTVRQDWPALDGFHLLRAAGQFSEEPPEPPKQAGGTQR